MIMETEVGMLELLALNMKKGATSQGIWAASKSFEKWTLYQNFHRECSPANTLTLAQ